MKRIIKIIIVIVGVVVVADVVNEFNVFNKYVRGVKPNQEYNAHGIVVLTGGASRIAEGLKLLNQNKNMKLLISGVNPEIIEDDIKKLNQERKALFECCVDIGYDAKNTKGNAKETKKWSKKNKFESLVVVTSDYHIPRAMLELKRAMPNTKLYPYPVKGEQKTNIIVVEFVKYYATTMVATTQN